MFVSQAARMKTDLRVLVRKPMDALAISSRTPDSDLAEKKPPV